MIPDLAASLVIKESLKSCIIKNKRPGGIPADADLGNKRMKSGAQKMQLQ